MSFDDQIMKDLIDTLSFKGRFSHYQELPPCVLKRLVDFDSNINYKPAQLPLDSSRYSWIISNLNMKNLNVIDLGANLGYFSVRLASESNANVYAYETLYEYAKSIGVFSKVCGLSNNLKVIQESINLENINELQIVDATLHLNVLHHAGIFFDHEKVTNIDDWYSYAVEHLRSFSAKSEIMVIQIGNMWNDKVLFDSQYSVDYICELLNQSNWDVDKIGLINDFNDFSYETYSFSDIGLIPRIGIWRNPATGLVEYKENNVTIAELSSGNAQRPIFLCKRQRD